MATFLIYILAGLGVAMIITVVGLILAQILINKADTAQTQTNILFEQSQGVVVDIDDLPEARQEPGVTVISNDAIEATSHHHRHLKTKTISVIDQDAQINTTMEQTHTINGLTTPDHKIVSSSTSIIDPLTDKITLEY
jgi:hypothetical protein